MITIARVCYDHFVIFMMNNRLEGVEKISPRIVSWL
jgi:hypothetical protein